MSLIGLLDLLGVAHPAYRSLEEGLESEEMVHRLEAPDAAKPYLIAALWHRLKVPVMVIVPNPEDSRRLHDELLSYLGDDASVHLFSEPEVLPFERLVADSATNNQRVLVLAALGQEWDVAGDGVGDLGPPPLVVASTAASLRWTLSPAAMKQGCHSLQLGAKAPLAQLFARWIALGYRREEGVEVPGTFSNRGGIVDIFPPSSPLPARIEFGGDEIESIRLFDPISQKSVRMVESVDVIPARETLPSLADRDCVSRLIGEMDFSRCNASTRDRFDEELASLFSGHEVDEFPFYNGLLNDGSLIDHLPKGGLLILDQEGEIESEGLRLTERAEKLRALREGRGELPGNFPSVQVSWPEFRLALELRRRLLVSGWIGSESAFQFRPPPSYYGRPQQFASQAPRMLEHGERVVVVSRNARRLAEILSEQGVGSTVENTLESPAPPGSLNLITGTMKEGWSLPLEGGGITLLTDSEIFGATRQRRVRSKTPVQREAFISEIVPGGFVVHIDHGVARFDGTIQMESDGREKEYLVLAYAEGDKIYVPTDHLDRVSPYVAPNDQVPSLTRLGTAEWSRIKERVKTSAREMAQELLELYASRQVVQGHALSPDSPWQQELEDAFPYEETSDQRRTIEEVKRDMEHVRPMDRLVCGDVGYGKTEVALRAAFKTVNDGMQVGLLVPTTVLAQQHYATFSQRLSPFPVRVESLSRFRTRNEQQEVVEGLKSGEVDVVIGTHRLLQKDVKFKNLGLVVVDEEQRFGVGHKERLKQMRREVDMLTLSATPIPRTLYMGLSGIRDMSTMETPPEERLPVKTYVCEYSEDIIKEAIERELERGGQVFFLHNRVQTIRRVADGLRRLVPDAKITVGHGRMAEGDLEDVMVSFTRGEVDVLVCTTIIESGLDIPNANTLIIDRADRFGLSQLYQLRGRVGRGGHRAYSYLMIPRSRRITEAAGKRLKVILEATELGAGFRIAMRDLEIRGAGNILGQEQSGHVHAVGFELYSQLLKEAVSEIKAGQDGEPGDLELQSAGSQARVSLSLAAHIPEDYISHLPTRLAIYQRLTKVSHRQDVDDIREELKDRFGPLPREVDNLLYLVGLKLLAGEASVESVTQSGSIVTLNLLEPAGGARLALERALGPTVKVGNQQVQVSIRRTDHTWTGELRQVLERLVAFREQLQLAMAPH